MVEHSSTNPKVPARFLAQSQIRVIDYDEACRMHLTPGVVHNFPKTVGGKGSPMHKKIPDFYSKREGGNL